MFLFFDFTVFHWAMLFVIRWNQSAEMVMRQNLTEGHFVQGLMALFTFYILAHSSRSNSANEGSVISLDR